MNVEIKNKYSNSVVFMAQGIDQKMEGKSCHEFDTSPETTFEFLESLRFCLMEMGYKVSIYKDLGSLKLGVWA